MRIEPQTPLRPSCGALRAVVLPERTGGTATQTWRADLVSGIAVAANGDLYLGDITGRTAQKFAGVEADVPVPSASTSR